MFGGDFGFGPPGAAPARPLLAAVRSVWLALSPSEADITIAARDLTEIIGGLYEAALDPALWAGVAPRLARSLEASSAVVKLQARHGLDLIDTTDNFAEAPQDQALAEYWHRNDLWVQRSAAVGFGRVVVGHELTPFDELEETGYYRDWLSRLAIRDMVGGVVRSGDAIGVIGVHRAPDEAAFGAAERAAMQALLPHLERAFRIRARLSDVAARAGLTALERTDLAVLVVRGPRLRVAFLNAPAERLLARGGGATVRAGRLVASDPVIQGKLDAALSLALANGRGAAAAPPEPVALPRFDDAPLIVSAAPLTGPIAGDGEPAALVILREARPARPDPGLLRAAFGLTRGESAVAGALCGGLSLPEVAAELGVGVSTVRSHLKSVMMKTHTRRQAELVALLLSVGRHG